MDKLKVILLFGLAVCLVQSSTLKNAEDVEISTGETVVETTENGDRFITENDSSGQTEDETSTEVSKSDETPIAIEDGRFFLMNLTVEKPWEDEFMDKSSKTFTTLANELGSELVDFVDNSVEASEVNTTTFHLIEVLPKMNQKIYTIFVITAKSEIEGETFQNKITNHININNEIYTHKVSSEGFELRNLDKATAEELIQNNGTVMCEGSGKNSQFSSFSKVLNIWNFDFRSSVFRKVG
jgi:hypothetical protein